MKASTVIRVGDKFLANDIIYEVVGTKPGGKIQLIQRDKSIFTDRWHRDVIKWYRIKN